MKKELIKNVGKFLTGIALATSFNSYSQDLIPKEYYECDTTFYNGKIKTITCKNDSTNFKYVDSFNQNGELSSEELYYGDELKMKKTFRQNKRGTLLEWDINGNGSIDKVLLHEKDKKIIKEDRDDDYHFDALVSEEEYKSSFEPFSTRQEELGISKEERKRSELVKEKVDSLNRLNNKKIKSLESKFEKTIQEIKKENDSKIDSLKNFYENKINGIENPSSKYKGNLDNVIVYYVGDIYEKGRMTHFPIKKIECYGDVELTAETMSVFMKADQPDFDPSARVFVVKEGEKRTYALPLIFDSSYDFSTEPSKKTEKEIEEILGKDVYMISPQEWGTRQMISAFLDALDLEKSSSKNN